MITEIIVSVAFACIAFFYCRKITIRRKLWWLKRVHGYPIIGSALDFIDSSKSLKMMEEIVEKTNGWGYFEVLNETNILVTQYRFVEWLLSSNTLLKKGGIYQVLNRWLEGGILISAGSKWKKGRKILTPAFHFNIQEKFVEVFEEPSNTLINILNTKAGEEQINIHPYLVKYTLDVICQTAMGVQLKVQESSHNDYSEAVSEMCRIVVERAFKPLKMNDYLYMLSSDYWKELNYVKLLHEVSDRVIEIKKREFEIFSIAIIYQNSSQDLSPEGKLDACIKTGNMI
ncbi:cytochrome P450 4e2-like [Euwallacea similis]|uniref:cytochrome P450 4e2-like n=1 Tax=Euwallacea similis TaxID=1736056 RepID=UPI00344BB5F5